MRNIFPVQNRVIVRQDPPKDKIGSFFVPQGKEDWGNLGTVVAVGPGLPGPDGVPVPPDVQVGDRVMFVRTPSTALAPDSREGASEWDGLLSLREDAIIGVVTEES